VREPLRKFSRGARAIRLLPWLAISFGVSILPWACSSSTSSPFSGPDSDSALDYDSFVPPLQNNCPALPHNGDSCATFDAGGGSTTCTYACNGDGTVRASAVCADAAAWSVDPPSGCDFYVDAGSAVDAASD
jgi:hypothetical protein